MRDLDPVARALHTPRNIIRLVGSIPTEAEDDHGRIATACFEPRDRSHEPRYTLYRYVAPPGRWYQLVHSAIQSSANAESLAGRHAARTWVSGDAYPVFPVEWPALISLLDLALRSDDEADETTKATA